MFNPPLDSGNDWEDVNVFSVQLDRFNYQHYFDLNFRADALLITVSTTVANVEYKFGGELFQFWEVAANKYQTKYAKLWFNNQNVVAIEPIERSRLLYRPPTYLYNWTIEVRARRYENDANEASLDFSEVITKLDLLRQQFELGFDVIDANTVDAFNSATQQRLEMLQQINQLDAGAYTLAEGLADLLPPERGNEIKRNAQNRLNLDLGFL